MAATKAAATVPVNGSPVLPSPEPLPPAGLSSDGLEGEAISPP